MRSLWAATEGIRYIMVCFLIMSVGMIWIIGCGGSTEEETPVEEPEISWEEESAEEGYYYGSEAARVANEVCQPHSGVRDYTYNDGLELILCEDGYVGSPYE